MNLPSAAPAENDERQLEIERLKLELAILDRRYRALDKCVQFLEASYGTMFAMNRLAQQILEIKELLTKLELEG